MYLMLLYMYIMIYNVTDSVVYWNNDNDSCIYQMFILY